MSSSIASMNFNYPVATPPSRATDFGPPVGPGSSLGSIDGTAGFHEVLNNTLSQVNALEGGAHQQVSAMLAGGGGDVSSVMIAVEKADVAFQLMMQVRNKIVSAYQDIEKMQF